uniref:26S proteasome non-ATPase regulatory subunit 5 n=1 Tax=Chenopodium quinoa TaxID=63459 RepID=A0A803LVH2_CHEQI
MKELSAAETNQLLEAATDFAFYPGILNEASVKEFLDRFSLPFIINDERVAAASMDAIKSIASSSEGIATIFPAESSEATDLKHLAAKCSSLGRVRILSLIVKLFSVSRAVAEVIASLNLLGLIEAEVRKTEDTLATLNALELLFEMAESEHASEFLPKTSLLQLLGSIIRNASLESMLRSRAMVISGRMLSRENIFTFIDETSVLAILSDIIGRLTLPETIDDNECESAIETIGLISSSKSGAEFLLLRSLEAARFLGEAAFDRHKGGKQLAALHAFGDIVGASRSENRILLKGEAEEILRRLIYEIASKTSKLTPSGLFLSVLQQDSEMRLAGYRLISSLVGRQWCLMEVCSRQEIISIVTDAYMETTKIGKALLKPTFPRFEVCGLNSEWEQDRIKEGWGMEAKYNCCFAIQKALANTNPKSDSALAAISGKLQEAVKRGPFLAEKNRYAQPTVTTDQRF